VGTTREYLVDARRASLIRVSALPARFVAATASGFDGSLQCKSIHCCCLTRASSLCARALRQRRFAARAAVDHCDSRCSFRAGRQCEGAVLTSERQRSEADGFEARARAPQAHPPAPTHAACVSSRCSTSKPDDRGREALCLADRGGGGHTSPELRALREVPDSCGAGRPGTLRCSGCASPRAAPRGIRHSARRSLSSNPRTLGS
jgi:hypothetical protein